MESCSLGHFPKLVPYVCLLFCPALSLYHGSASWTHRDEQEVVLLLKRKTTTPLGGLFHYPISFQRGRMEYWMEAQKKIVQIAQKPARWWFGFFLSKRTDSVNGNSAWQHGRIVYLYLSEDKVPRY